MTMTSAIDSSSRAIEANILAASVLLSTESRYRLSAFETAPPDIQEILKKPIKELGLKLEGSPLERFVQKLYRELDSKGLKKFRPLCYLSDEWGCP